MANGMFRDHKDVHEEAFRAFEFDHGQLRGITDPRARTCLCQQIISSQRRIDYIRQISEREIERGRSDPHSQIFDPIRGAIFNYRNKHLDEAVWLTFVQTHFGKHEKYGWKLAANIYGSFGRGPIWTFEEYTRNSAGFDQMLLQHRAQLQNSRLSGSFSNHRKYQSKNPEKTSRVFRTFHEWQTHYGNFSNLIIETHKEVGQNPEIVFNKLYKSMRSIYGFGGGRLGRFDFLTMIGKLHLAPILPGSVYLQGATGPLAGARLLFYGRTDHPTTASQLEPRVNQLDEYLNVGKQVIEDSICNWQKSPKRYVYFRG